jgi:signal transduction histidine kinase
VLRNDATLSRFKDKIVILGRDIQTTSKDYVRTPYSRDIVAMTIVELSANMFDTLIRNDAPKQAPRWLNLLITTMISYLTVLVVLTLTPTTGLLILGSTIGGYFLLSLVAFWLGGWWVDVAHPFLVIFICYYFFIPYRLIIENRRSWEYYQKNKLLTQVEELKTNFLSMMSHDLKTPIARIQGMAEVVRSDKNPLSPTQAEAIDTLRRSSDELLEFISSVLNLGRIESKAIQLHLQSKDVNALLKEVVSKLEYLAGSKNIDIRTELEPLFSIKFDVDLIRQVLSNLVENAIKYSPEKTSILVSSEERDGWIVVQVADQGPGIPEDELPHIFMKFYRSRNAKGSAIKGSGLGLYLAKYFVELHKGRIQVDSTLGQGSTFTVELPAG